MEFFSRDFLSAMNTSFAGTAVNNGSGSSILDLSDLSDSGGLSFMDTLRQASMLTATANTAKNTVTAKDVASAKAAALSKADMSVQSDSAVNSGKSIQAGNVFDQAIGTIVSYLSSLTVQDDIPSADEILNAAGMDIPDAEDIVAFDSAFSQLYLKMANSDSDTMKIFRDVLEVISKMFNTSDDFGMMTDFNSVSGLKSGEVIADSNVLGSEFSDNLIKNLESQISKSFADQLPVKADFENALALLNDFANVIKAGIDISVNCNDTNNNNNTNAFEIIDEKVISDDDYHEKSDSSVTDFIKPDTPAKTERKVHKNYFNFNNENIKAALVSSASGAAKNSYALNKFFSDDVDFDSYDEIIDYPVNHSDYDYTDADSLLNEIFGNENILDENNTDNSNIGLSVETSVYEIIDEPVLNLNSDLSKIADYPADGLNDIDSAVNISISSKTNTDITDTSKADTDTEDKNPLKTNADNVDNVDNVDKSEILADFNKSQTVVNYVVMKLFECFAHLPAEQNTSVTDFLKPSVSLTNINTNTEDSDVLSDEESDSDKFKMAVDLLSALFASYNNTSNVEMSAVLNDEPVNEDFSSFISSLKQISAAINFISGKNVIQDESLTAENISDTDTNRGVFFKLFDNQKMQSSGYTDNQIYSETNNSVGQSYMNIRANYINTPSYGNNVNAVAENRVNSDTENYVNNQGYVINAESYVNSTNNMSRQSTQQSGIKSLPNGFNFNMVRVNNVSEQINALNNMESSSDEGKISPTDVEKDLFRFVPVKPVRTEQASASNVSEQNKANVTEEKTSNNVSAELNTFNVFDTNKVFVPEKTAVSTLSSYTANSVEQQVTQQVTAKIFDLSGKDGVSEVTIVLKPENLGEIAVKITSRKGAVEIVMAAQNESVGKVLNDKLSALSASLSNQNIEVKNINVVNPSDASSQMGLDFSNQGFNRRQNAEDYDSDSNSSRKNTKIADDIADLDKSKINQVNNIKLGGNLWATQA